MEKKIFILWYGISKCIRRVFQPLKIASRLLSKAIFLLGLAMLLVSTDICAEEDQYSKVKDIELEPITVTASRAAKIVSETPASVSIVSKQDIAQTNAKSVVDLLKNIEGVYMYDPTGVGGTGAVVNMRGFYGGMSSHQLVLVDGIPQNKGKDKLIDWDLISMETIESIEVVRGPASALYGDNAMSGVINIITKKPKDKPESKFSASYGSFSTQEYEASTLGVYKQLGYFVGTSYKTSDGFRRHCDYDRTHVGGKLDYAINDAQALKLSLNYYQKERGALSWALSEAQIAQDRRQARPGTENDKSNETKSDASITHAWDVSSNVKTEETFYYKYDNVDSFYTSSSLTQKEQLEDEDVYGFMLKGSINQEIMGLVHEFTTGVDLERDNFDYKEYAASYQQRGALQRDCKVKRDKIGPFLQDEIKLIDPLRLIAGVRYDRVKFDFDDQKTVANSKTEKMSKVTPRWSLVYMYQKDSSLYVNYAQAFRTPTMAQMFTYSGGGSANPDLKPEEATNYEIGLHHCFNEFLKTNVSLYWMKLDNEIWLDEATSKYQNYGKTSHKGVETSLDFRVAKWLSGFANYTYSRAKNETGIYSGKYLTSIPIHKASLGLHFATKFGLSWDLATTYVGNSYIDSTNDNKLLSYTTVDTKLNYEYKAMKIFLAINNLSDKKYNLYGYTSGNTKYFNPAPERTFTAGVEMKF